MTTKLILASIAIVAAFIAAPAAGAVDLNKTTDILAQLAPNLGCGNGLVPEASFPDPTNPTLTESVSILCPGDVNLDSHIGTDCPGDSYSFWASPAAGAKTYTYDTTNPYGFSQSAVAAAWDGANTVWDSQIAFSSFAGHVFGGSGNNVGVADGVNQAGFKLMKGQLGTAIAVQYAWQSGGKIVESDSGYNTKYAESMTGESGKYDLQGVAAQEMGHGLGMGHSDTSSASACLTMYPYGTTGTTMGRTLGDGDIAGIKARYP